jgi:hypothetical protein
LIPIVYFARQIDTALSTFSSNLGAPVEFIVPSNEREIANMLRSRMRQLNVEEWRSAKFVFIYFLLLAIYK